MNRGNALPLVGGMLLAGLIMFLLAHSQVDEKEHVQTVRGVSQLQHLDATLGQALLRLEAGRPIPGSLNAISAVTVQQDLDRLRSTLLRSVDPLYRRELSRLLDTLSDAYRRKLLLLDSYRDQLLRLHAMYAEFQELARSLPGKLAGAVTAPPQDLLDALEAAGSVGTETAFLVRDRAGSAPLLQSALRELARSYYRLSPDLQDEVLLLIGFSALTQSAAMDSEQTLRDLLAIPSGELLWTLNQRYQAMFQVAHRDAHYYRVCLVVALLTMLAYLALIFHRLQRTGQELRKLVSDLEFQKFALDEHAIVSITDVTGKIIYANDRFCTVSQYSRDELIGAKHSIVRSDTHDREFFRTMWRTIANGRVWHGIVCNRAKDGSLYWVESTLVPRLGDQGKPVAYIGIRTDITQQVKAENEVEILARLPEESPEPVLRVTPGGKLCYANRPAQRLLKEWKWSIGDKAPDEWLAALSRSFELNRPEDFEISVAARNFVINIVPIKDAGYLNLYGRDVTEKHEAQAQLSYQAEYDQLTGLKNRYSFERALTRAMELAHTKDQEAVLVYIDLDQFKVVNDTCGHVAGDELLRRLSLQLTQESRDSDLIARLGGDEFGLILNHCPLDRGISVAEALLARIRSFRFVWENSVYDIGASIGVVSVSKDRRSMAEILGAADMACYAAKESGRNRVFVYQDEMEETKRRKEEMQWAARIPQALSEDRFVLMAQAISPLQQQEELGHYEVLVRMVDTDGSFIPPGAFIPAAERYGLMSAIDHWVVRNLVQFIDRARQQGHDTSNWRFAVNLSGASLARLEMVDFISEQIETHSIEPGMLGFEVTETAAITNLDAAVQFIRRLRALGCRFALDDFGSGLSSFAYLKNLPVDYLKIDGTFVRDMLTDPIDAAMVQAINQIGQVMQIKTIAEFAENKPIIEKLTGIGVDYAQGYGIDRPRPLEEIFRLWSDEESTDRRKA